MINYLLNNTLFIGVLFYIIIMTLSGHKRGLFRIAISTLSLILTLFLSGLFFPNINKIIKENTGIQNGIRNIMLNNIGVENISSIDAQSEEEQNELIESLNIPYNMKKALKNHNEKDIYEQLGVDNFKEYVARYTSSTILNIIMFVIVFVIIWIILHILMEVLDLFAKIPIIHGLNQIGGAFVGFANAIIILWILSLFLSTMVGTVIGSKIISQIEKNWLLSFIFNNNLLSLFMRKKLYGIF